jgi:hypothetical protein
VHVRQVAEPLDRIRRRRAEGRARAAADAELLAARLPSPRLAWRTAELVAAEHRLQLARETTEIVRHADGATLPGASPLDRPAARAARAQLLALASRLADLDRPVTPRGVLLAWRLLTAGESPLYRGESHEPLRTQVEQILEALEPSAR